MYLKTPITNTRTRLVSPPSKKLVLRLYFIRLLSGQRFLRRFGLGFLAAFSRTTSFRDCLACLAFFATIYSFRFRYSSSCVALHCAWRELSPARHKVRHTSCVELGSGELILHQAAYLSALAAWPFRLAGFFARAFEFYAPTTIQLGLRA